MMDESQYGAATAAAFKRLMAALDTLDPDLLEADSTGDMVTMTAPRTGQKVVVNTQRAVRQLWVAGKGQGVHFSLGADGRWTDDKGKGLELFAWIADCVADACGERLKL